MNDTLFYVLGIGLVVAALAVSAAGLKVQGFPPSRRVLGGVLALFAVLVVATAVFGWRSAEDEQEHRDAELAAEHTADSSSDAEGAVSEDQTNTAPGGTEEPGAGGGTAPVDGAAIFDAQGCASCHSLEAAGARGTVGPSLDESLVDQDTDFILESIVEPTAQVAKGYDPVMPQTYGEDLAPDELDALVQYLAESTGARSQGAEPGTSGG